MPPPINRLPRARPVPNAALARPAPDAVRPRPVPNDVLQQLADLGHVLAAKREFFFDEVQMHVQTACELDGLAKQGLTSKYGKNVAGAALALYDALGNLTNRERELIEKILKDKASFFDRISSGGVGGLEQTIYQLARLTNLLTGKPPPRYPDQPPEPAQPGRRSGTVKNAIYQEFAWQLLLSANAAGGRLTIERNIGTGSLITALNTLAPYLPDSLPKKLSPSTLERLRVRLSRVSRDYQALEDELS